LGGRQRPFGVGQRSLRLVDVAPGPGVVPHDRAHHGMARLPEVLRRVPARRGIAAADAAAAALAQLDPLRPLGQAVLAGVGSAGARKVGRLQVLQVFAGLHRRASRPGAGARVVPGCAATGSACARRATRLRPASLAAYMASSAPLIQDSTESSGRTPATPILTVTGWPPTETDSAMDWR